MLPLCIDQCVGVIPWSPVAREKLTRAPDEASGRAELDTAIQLLYGLIAAADRKVVEAVGEVACARCTARAQVALAWLIQKQGVSAPIIGVTKPHHLQEAVAALDVSLSAAEIESLERDNVSGKRRHGLM